MHHRNASVAIVGAGDFIGAAIAQKFAAEGFVVFAGRRKGEKLAPLVAAIEAAGGRVVGRSVDARQEDRIAEFLREADAAAPLEECIFNVGANVNFPLIETTERVFRKMWEMACYAGFLTAREAARLMLPRGRGNIFFTGATAGLRGGVGYAAFASAKFNYVPVLLGGVFKLTGNRSPAESLAGIRNKPDYERLETERFLKRHGITSYRRNPFFPVNT